MSYAELQVTTHFSFLRGASSPDELFAAAALLGLPALAAIAWSRTVLDAHSWPQVIFGALLGAAVAVGVFPPLR